MTKYKYKNNASTIIIVMYSTNLCFIENHHDKITTELVEIVMDQSLPKFIKTRNNTLLSGIDTKTLMIELQKPYRRQVHHFFGNIYLYYVIDNQYYVDINHIITILTNQYKIHRFILNNYFKHISRTIYTVDSTNGQVMRRDLVNVNILMKMTIQNECEFSKIFRLELVIYFITLYILMFYAYLLFWCYILTNNINFTIKNDN